MDTGIVLPLGLLNNDLVFWNPGTPGAAAGRSDQCNFRSTVYAAVHPRLGTIPICCKACSYVFKIISRLHSKEAVDRDNKWVDVVTLKEASLQVLTLFLGVHSTHVMNNFYPSLTKVLYQQISLLLGILFSNRCILWE